ncbi:hypothetical protein PGT21_031567 [Puccinia graminis f. sp. tritici]|uniref:Uncharacterized protein n=1 Tax=Puccinia graminis f. sp. tritici TaxID=56615 RepID=A0A5B0PUX5_PUCGR|nr:hypothetical protein PGTUg99_006940 [Puccinia graminis f. sp. tritici]KAA1104776.1 hypothetical protein PGT21_031567 [Puccinia graminis f. sp. tritici]
MHGPWYLVTRQTQVQFQIVGQLLCPQWKHVALSNCPSLIQDSIRQKISTPNGQRHPSDKIAPTRRVINPASNHPILATFRLLSQSSNHLIVVNNPPLSTPADSATL